MSTLNARNGQTWLICGGRNFTDQALFDAAMSNLVSQRGYPDAVVHGAARGADTMGGEWARQTGLQEHAVPAKWEKYGGAAGSIRNYAMLDRYRPHLVIAFPGGRGTSHMISIARKAEIEVVEIKAART